jgi:glutamate/tyrosine decarboxylase-like PLP-dependent enzyme
VASDAAGRMRPDALETELKKVSGPTIVIGQAGQINTGACDPFEQIAPLVKAAGAWLHVDGAFGLWAQACPTRAHLTAGIEQADSWSTDGHKWLQTPYDCGYAIVRDAAAHRRAMAITASYLPPAEEGEREPSSYVPELSRRARGFATWAMMRQLGRNGIADMVEHHCSIAERMAAQLAKAPGVELVNAVELNQFMLRFGGADVDRDEVTRNVIAATQEDAIAFIGGAQWRGEWVMRVSVTSIATTMADADQTIEAILAAWRRVADCLAARDAKNEQRVVEPVG